MCCSHCFDGDSFTFLCGGLEGLSGITADRRVKTCTHPAESPVKIRKQCRVNGLIYRAFFASAMSSVLLYTVEKCYIHYVAFRKH